MSPASVRGEQQDHQDERALGAPVALVDPEPMAFVADLAAYGCCGLWRELRMWMPKMALRPRPSARPGSPTPARGARAGPRRTRTPPAGSAATTAAAWRARLRRPRRRGHDGNRDGSAGRPSSRRSSALFARRLAERSPRWNTATVVSPCARILPDPEGDAAPPPGAHASASSARNERGIRGPRRSDHARAILETVQRTPRSRRGRNRAA